MTWPLKYASPPQYHLPKELGPKWTKWCRQQIQEIVCFWQPWQQPFPEALKPKGRRSKEKQFDDTNVYLLFTSPPPCAFYKSIATSSLSERWLVRSQSRSAITHYSLLLLLMQLHCGLWTQRFKNTSSSPAEIILSRRGLRSKVEKKKTDAILVQLTIARVKFASENGIRVQIWYFLI